MSLVADQFSIDAKHLKRHIMTCATYVLSTDEFDKEVAAALAESNPELAATLIPDQLGPSGAMSVSVSGVGGVGELSEQNLSPGYRKRSLLKLIDKREAEYLNSVAQEYLQTLHSLGKKINIAINKMDDVASNGAAVAKMMLTKQVCELYVSLGSEIRQTVNTLSSLNKDLKSPEDGTNTGLLALANAIADR